MLVVDFVDLHHDGSLQGTTHRNGVTTAKAYDGVGRLLGTGHSAPGGLLLGGESYTLDSMSRRTSRTFADGTGDVFGYDAVGQVIDALYATANAATQATAGGWTPTATWDYDNAGNRTAASDNGTVTTYAANNLNQYTAINAAAPTYNANGDLLTDQTRSYTWNGRSQMTSVTTGSVTESHNFDALSRRIARTDASGTTYFIHDGWNVIAEYKRLSAANVLQRRYIWGQDLSGSLQGAGGVGGLVCAEEVSGATSTPYSFRYDGNGNVVEITNASAAVAASYRYDAYGTTVASSGSYAATNRYRFSTKPVELASGLYFYGYRFYDPVNGRWTTRDPIGERGGVNLYCVFNIVNAFDYLGLCDCIINVVIVESVELSSTPVGGTPSGDTGGAARFISESFFEWLVKKEGAESVTSLGFGFSWRITVKTSKKCGENWIAQPDYVKTPSLGGAASGIVYASPTLAINAGNAIKKQARDEALAQCCEK